MKKTGIISILVMLILSACVSLGVVNPGGTKKTEMYTLSSFNAVSISGSISMEIVNGSQGVEINTYENVFPYIETEVKNGTLDISTKNVSFIGKPEIKVYVSSDLVNTIKSSGSSNVYLNAYKISELTLKSSGSSNTTGDLTGSLILTTSGSSNTALNLVGQNLHLDASGSSDFNFSGAADNLSIKLSGSSKVNAFEFVTQKATIKSSGSSKMDLFVEQTLNLNMSGSSKVNYKGNASITEIKLSGSSKVQKVD